MVFDLRQDLQEERPREVGEPERALQEEALAFLAEIKSLNLELSQHIGGGDEGEIQSDPELQDRLRALGYVDEP